MAPNFGAFRVVVVLDCQEQGITILSGCQAVFVDLDKKFITVKRITSGGTTLVFGETIKARNDLPSMGTSEYSKCMWKSMLTSCFQSLVVFVDLTKRKNGPLGRNRRHENTCPRLPGSAAYVFRVSLTIRDRCNFSCSILFYTSLIRSTRMLHKSLAYSRMK